MSASALGIYEILHEIFLQLKVATPDNSIVINNRRLAQAALTCKAFSEPALDVLWEEMDSITPLLRILPALQEEDGKLMLLGPVTPGGWLRLEHYARRIRKIRCNPYPDEDGVPVIDSSVYIRLARLIHGESLLPSLHTISCNEPSDVAFLCLSLSLRNVYIYDASGSDTVGPFLHALVDIAPSVGGLSINSDSLIKSSLDALTRFEHLSSLTINTQHVDQPALNLLASLSCLLVLSINLSHADSHFFENTRHEQRYFHDLRHLDIRGCARLSTEFLSRLTGTTFRSLEVTDSWSGDPLDLALLKRTTAAWRALFEELPRFSESLQKLVVRYYCRHTHTADYYDQIRATSVLQPLLHLRNLERLTFFDDFLPMSLVDADVDDIARAWPMMRHLELPSTLGTIRPTAITIESFARFCPHLTFLQLSVDLRVLPPIQRACLTPHSLEILGLKRSLGGDPVLLARYLDGLFPSACIWILDCGMEEQEGEIDRALKVCRAARSN